MLEAGADALKLFPAEGQPAMLRAMRRCCPTHHGTAGRRHRRSNMPAWRAAARPVRHRFGDLQAGDTPAIVSPRRRTGLAADTVLKSSGTRLAAARPEPPTRPHANTTTLKKTRTRKQRE